MKTNSKMSLKKSFGVLNKDPFSDKKGVVLGRGIVMIVATIIIIFLLVIYFLGSTFIKKIGKTGPGEIGVIDEEKLGIRDAVFYPYEDLVNLVEIRKRIFSNRSIEAEDYRGLVNG